MSFLAKIYIEGRERNVLNAEILYHQFIDMHGKPSSTVQGGTLLVRVASTDADDDLYEWMFSPLMMKSGYLRFFKRDAMSRLFDLVFYDCFCVGLHESFRAYGDGGMYIDLTLIPGIQEIRGARYEKPWKKTDLDALKAAPTALPAEPETCTHTRVEEVTTYIVQEMQRNIESPIALQIKEHNRKAHSFSFWDVVFPKQKIPDVYEKYQAYEKWKKQVNYGKDWDHKKKIIEKYQHWSCDNEEQVCYLYDIWSNIHYGYVGLLCGFTEWELLNGAGYAQMRSDMSKENTEACEDYWNRRFEKFGDGDVFAACDPPSDQESIKIGFDLWKNHRHAISPSLLLQKIREHKGRLSSKRCPNKHP